jgi:hypothetical protein
MLKNKDKSASPDPVESFRARVLAQENISLCRLGTLRVRQIAAPADV